MSIFVSGKSVGCTAEDPGVQWAFLGSIELKLFPSHLSAREPGKIVQLREIPPELIRGPEELAMGLGWTAIYAQRVIARQMREGAEPSRRESVSRIASIGSAVTGVSGLRGPPNRKAGPDDHAANL